MNFNATKKRFESKENYCFFFLSFWWIVENITQKHEMQSDEIPIMLIHFINREKYADLTLSLITFTFCVSKMILYILWIGPNSSIVSKIKISYKNVVFFWRSSQRRNWYFRKKREYKTFSLTRFEKSWAVISAIFLLTMTTLAVNSLYCYKLSIYFVNQKKNTKHS